MRKIIFRGKAISTGEWVYGSLINNAFFFKNGRPATYIGVFESEEFDSFQNLEDSGDIFEVHPSSVGQFTGLVDKGRDVYEGDCFDYKGQMVFVEYVGDMFHLKSTKYPNLSDGNYRLETLIIHNQVKFLGNTTDNPEMEVGMSKIKRINKPYFNINGTPFCSVLVDEFLMKKASKILCKYKNEIEALLLSNKEHLSEMSWGLAYPCRQQTSFYSFKKPSEADITRLCSYVAEFKIRKIDNLFDLKGDSEHDENVTKEVASIITKEASNDKE